MANCVHCGDAAGFLRRKHKSCKNRYNVGKSNIASLVANASTRNDDLNGLRVAVEKIASESYIKQNTLKKLIVLGWQHAVETVFEDGVLTQEEESNLVRVKKYFCLTEDDLDTQGDYSRVVKGAVLRDILDGKIPDRIILSNNIPFNLQKSESIIWVFNNVDYYEDKTKTKYVGGSQGVSIRIAKGLYYRTSAFKGNRVQTTKTEFIDSGLMAITNKHIYFSGDEKKFRIKFDKIVTFDRYSDGIGVQRDAQSAKPQTFINNDGWFLYNLLTNLSQMRL